MTKPMTDEWIKQIPDVFREMCELDKIYDNDMAAAGCDTPYDILEKFINQIISQATSKAMEEERNRIKTILIHKGWHETSCPAHSNNMRSESECDCLYSFVLESLKKDK